MAQASQPAPVKLICGMIASDAERFADALGPLVEAFGPTDLLSEVAAFDFTDYYNAEMGSPLWRQFASFARTVAPESLVEAKIRTNAIEAEFAAQAPGRKTRRPINLDPGIIEPSKLVLASMKNFSHRIYLGRGVYGEVTLLYHRGRWEALGWTFPDYASGRYNAFLDASRALLRAEAGS